MVRLVRGAPVAIAAVSLLALLFVPGASAGERHVEHAIVPPSGRGAAPYPFLLSLPPDYRTNPRRWPLLLFLHGAGHGGDDLWRLITLGPPRLIEGGAALRPAEAAVAQILTAQFIVVSPQSPLGARWDERRLVALLNFVTAEVRVDRRRVYVTGASMGGFGTWLLGVRHPDLIAAIAPVCGGGSPRDVAGARGEQRSALGRLGVWAFHNDNDPTVDFGESRRMVDAFKQIGAADVQLTVYHSNRHDAWTKAYDTPELYAWLLKHALAEDEN